MVAKPRERDGIFLSLPMQPGLALRVNGVRLEVSSVLPRRLYLDWRPTEGSLETLGVFAANASTDCPDICQEYPVEEVCVCVCMCSYISVCVCACVHTSLCVHILKIYRKRERAV